MICAALNGENVTCQLWKKKAKQDSLSGQYLPPKDDNDPVTLTQTRTHVSLGSIVGNFQKDQKIFLIFSKVKHSKL